MSSSNGHGRPLSVGIVGAGFGGVGIGIKLKQAGIDDFTIFERGERVGGVWRANTYPGAACDVPSHLYSFSFAPGHHWSKRYAPGPEILSYLDEITREYGIEPHLRLGTEVTSAEFDAELGCWTLNTDDGESHGFDVLVTACGQLTRPAIPRIEGLDDFKGPAFHSAEWDHEHDLAGQNVAVIGTGASAIQFVPEIAPRVEKLTIYQRSAPWVIPKNDRNYPVWERRLFRRFPDPRPRQPAGPVHLLRVGHLRVHRPRLGDEAVRGGRQARARQAAQRPRAASEGNSRLPDRLQADPVHRATGIRPWRETTSSS